LIQVATDLSREWAMTPVLARARARLAHLRARAGERAEEDEREARPAPAGERPLTARDVMTGEVVSVPPEESLRAVCELMRQREIGAVPVVDLPGRVIGLVTDRDIVVRAVAARRDVDQISAGDIMSVGIECAELDTPVELIREKMARYRVRRIPVLDGYERLVGIVSRDDLPAE
jgi:CBS domain-containing protein